MERTSQKQKKLRRGGKNTQKNCTKKNFTTQIIMMVWIIQLEPDILQSEVRWALESITMNKANGGDEFQLSYFKS